jgi:DNA polymerase-3 subunit epsilon
VIRLWKKRLPSDILSRNINDCRYVVIDTELTGLNYKKDEIVSIGGIKMAGKRIELGKTFYATVKPRHSLTGESIIIHNITPSEVKDSPSIDSVIINFLNFCEDAIIVGHFISLDITFINRELNNAIKQKIENPLLDTVAIYDWIENHRLRTIGYDEIMSGEKDLFSIAKKYNITISESHNALIDAFITAQLFQRFLIQLQIMGIIKVKDLLKIGSP